MAKSQTQPRADNDSWGEEIGSGALIAWDEPKVVIGTLVALDEVEGQYGKKPRATFMLDDGSQASTFPPSMLAARLEQVPLDTRIRIEYAGTTVKSKSGRDVKVFSVRADKNGKGLHAQAFSGEIPA